MLPRGKKNVTIYMDGAVWQELRNAARAENRTLSNYLKTILRNYLIHNHRKKKREKLARNRARP